MSVLRACAVCAKPSKSSTARSTSLRRVEQQAAHADDGLARRREEDFGGNCRTGTDV